MSFMQILVVSSSEVHKLQQLRVVLVPSTDQTVTCCIFFFMQTDRGTITLSFLRESSLADIC